MKYLFLALVFSFVSHAYSMDIYTCSPARVRNLPVGSPSYSVRISKASGKKYHLTLSAKPVRPGAQSRILLSESVRYEAYEGLSTFYSERSDLTVSIRRQMSNDGTFSGIIQSEVLSTELKCFAPLAR